VDLHQAKPRPTGIVEFDRVLGGGFVPGSVTLLGGEPGVGKSTLLLQVLRSVARAGAPVVLLSAEESAQQVRLRAERLGPIPGSLLLVSGTDLCPLFDAVAKLLPSLVVVDSIQTVATTGASGGPGSMTQVRACADELVALAKGHDVPIVLVSHVTKDGVLAGPRALEHLVDTVLTVEGDRHHAVRLLRSVKHRFAPTGELGLFEMGERGLTAVLDPYRFLLGDRRPGVPGSMVLPAIEGQRALLVELQALVAPSVPSMPPRRSAKGVDGGRFTLVLAVLERRTTAFRGLGDVFASVVGGMRVLEPAADLALALAVASATTGVPVPPDMVAFGEVGLGGEIRQVPDAGRRLAEAARVGFRRALVPAFCPDGPDQLELVRAHTLDDAVSCSLSAGQAA
jgi:DNA repair protein RadA/Sms